MSFVADWSVWCASVSIEGFEPARRCPTWSPVEGHRIKQREAWAKSLGWKKIKGIGWLCEHCAKVYKESK